MRNRIFYQSEGLFVGPTGTGALLQLHRIQSANHTETINRTPVNELGHIGQLDRVILAAPTVSLTFEALLANAVNAKRLGFNTDGTVTCIAPILTGGQDQKNYYIAVSNEGTDLLATTGNGVFGFGNGFISNAAFAGAVGGFPTESYTVDALNYCAFPISSGDGLTVNQSNGLPITGNPFVIPVGTTGVAGTPAALQPGDITVTIADTLGFVTNELKIQNFNITIPLAREDLGALGSKFAFAKFITFPVTVTTTFSTVAGSIAQGCLAEKLCSDAPVNLSISLREPNCEGTGNVMIKFDVKGVKLDSTNFSTSLTANATVDFNYSCQLGGPSETTIGCFISGISS